MNSRLLAVFSVLAVWGLGGCYTVRIADVAGWPTTYEDVESPGTVTTTKIELQDIISATTDAMGDMLKGSWLSKWEKENGRKPRLVIDSEAFFNESTYVFDKNFLTTRLRAILSQSAGNRITILGRHYLAAVEKENVLEEAGIVTAETESTQEGVPTFDFRLGGRVADQVRRDSAGYKSREHQITFELFDRKTEVVWSSRPYEFRKTGRDSLQYRD